MMGYNDIPAFLVERIGWSYLHFDDLLASWSLYKPRDLDSLVAYLDRERQQLHGAISEKVPEISAYINGERPYTDVTLLIDSPRGPMNIGSALTRLLTLDDELHLLRMAQQDDAAATRAAQIPIQYTS